MPMIEATPAYRILTSRSSLTGADGLNAVNTTPINQGALILVGDTLWRLDRTSTAVADNITVVAPITGPGRWHEVMAMGDELSVPNITALKLLPASSPVRVWVESVKCYWRRELGSPYTPDDITVAAAIGGGNWERIVATTVLDWLQQSDLYINPTTGHDENPGTLAMPVRTLDELTRRLSVGPLQQHTTFHVAAGTIASGTLDVDGGGHDLTLVGNVTHVVTTTVSAWTFKSAATPESSLLEATGVLDWTTLVGHRVTVTHAAVDYMLWVAVQNPGGAGVDVARVTPGDVAIIPTDVLTIDSLNTTIEELVFTSRDQTSRIFVRDINAEVIYLSTNNNVGTDPAVSGCAIYGSYVYPGGIVPVRDTRNDDAGDEYRYLNVTATLLSQYPCTESDFIRFADCLFLSTYAEFRDGIDCVNSLFQESEVHCIGGKVELGSSLALGNSQAFGASFVEVTSGQVYLDLSGAVTGATAVAVTGEGPIFVKFADSTMNFLGATRALAVVQGSNTSNFATWATVVYDSDEQHGVADLSAGAGTLVVTARNATRGVMLSYRDVIGTPGTLSAPVAQRTETQFQIVTSGGAADDSTVDWYIPKQIGDVVIIPDTSNNLPPN